MCGLVGTFGLSTHREKSAFKWLLHLDVLRGAHSTGIAAIHLEAKEDIYSVYKKVGTPEGIYQAYPKDFVDGVYDYLATDCLIGHNRYATQGAITDENAHPFEFANVIGAHNGTVIPWSIKDLHNADQYKIDSQIIYSQLNHSPDLQTVWDAADGALALSWFDKRDRMLHLARNAERPLHYVYTKDGLSIFWASEAWMLETVLARTHIQHTEIKEVAANCELSFEITDKGVVEYFEELTPFVKKPVAPVCHPAKSALLYDKPIWAENGTLKIVEYCKDGLDDFSGYFVGHNTDGEEIIIPLFPNVSEAIYMEIKAKLDDFRPWFQYSEDQVWFKNNYLTLLPQRLVHMKYMVDVPAKRAAEVKEMKEVGEKESHPFVDFFGVPQSRKSWHDLYMRDMTICTCCLKRIDHHGAAQVQWVSQDELVCGACLNEPWVQQYLGTTETNYVS